MTETISNRFEECREMLMKQGCILPGKLSTAEVAACLAASRRAQSRHGFMGRYYYMMRLLDAFLALNGMVLTNTSPHHAAGVLLAKLFPENGSWIRALGPARHAHKYYRKPVSDVYCITLDWVIQKIDVGVQECSNV